MGKKTFALLIFKLHSQINNYNIYKYWYTEKNS